MNHLPPSWRSKFWGPLKSYPYTVVGSVTLLVVGICFCRRQDSEWESVYLPAAAHLWKGEDMYRPAEGYLYPPFMAWTALPFLASPAPLVRFAWLFVSLSSLLAMLRWSWRLAGGPRLEGPYPAKPREHLAALFGGLCGIFALHNCLAHQQTDVVIGAALVGGCLLLVRGRSMLAATAFGLAAASKCTGLLWAPYLLWRGRPVAAAWVLVVALSVNLLPDLVSGAPGGRPWLVEYANRFLKPLTASSHYVGSWASDPIYNQSLSGTGQRWFTTTCSWTPSDCTIQARAQPMNPQTLRAGVYGFQAFLLLSVLWICRWPFRRIVADSEGRQQALECGIVLLLMLLLSPMSSKAHFGTLLVPGFCLARAAVQLRSRFLWGAVAVAVLLGLLSNKDPLGERLYTLSLWCSVVTWQTLLLLVGCLVVLRRGQSVVSGQIPDANAPGSEASRGEAA